MDLKNLMQMAQQLRQQMESAQSEAEQVRGIGEAGGGLVRAVLNGHHDLVELKLDPQLLKGQDLPFIEDLIRAAINQANTQVAGALKKRLGGMATGMGLDPSALDALDLGK